MKTAIVPAQVTSIEDLIVANLSLTQIILLIVPVFMAVFVFAGLPPVMHLKPYKLVVLILLSLPEATLAIRIRGQLVLKWLAVLLAYQIRPRVYLLSQRSGKCTCLVEKTIVTTPKPNTDTAVKTLRTHQLLPQQNIEINDFLSGKQIKFIRGKKGLFSAIIEVK
jgi:hypothetical protein